MGCEVLLRVKDKSSDDPRKDIRLLKRGDVVVVCPEGHPWSVAERSNPDWRIVHFPNVSVSEASVYLSEVPGDDRVNPYRYRRANGFSLNHPSLPAAFQAFLADDARSQPAYVSQFTAAQAGVFSVLKQAPTPPNVIG